jgi:hypothetical protein
VKELGRSKWSNDLDEDDTERTEKVKRNLNALSGLIQAYGKETKSVRWADQVFIDVLYYYFVIFKARMNVNVFCLITFLTVLTNLNIRCCYLVHFLGV